MEFFEIDAAVSVIRHSSDQDRFGDEFWTPSLDNIRRMLFQSASVVECLGDALQKLQAEEDALWAPRKSSSPAYYQALKAYEAARADFKRAILSIKDWKAQSDVHLTSKTRIRLHPVDRERLYQQH